MFLIPKSPIGYTWIYVTQSLGLLIKAICYPFLQISIYNEGMPLREEGQTKRLKILFHYNAFDFKLINQKIFGVKYNEPIDKKQNKIYLNIQPENKIENIKKPNI